MAPPRRRKKPPTLQRWHNPFANNNPITGAGNTAAHAAGGGKGGGSAAAAGVSSISSGVGAATGTSPTSTAASGVSSVSSGVAQGSQASAPLPTSSSPLSPVTIAALGLTQTEAGLVPYVLDAAAQNKVSPAMLMGLIENQSGFKPSARLGHERGLGMFGPDSSHAYDVKHGDDPAAIKSQVDGLAAMLSDADVNDDPIGALNMWSRGDHGDFAERVMAAAQKYRPLDEALKPLATRDGLTKAVDAAKAARSAAAGLATAGLAAERTTGGWGSDDAIAVAHGQKPLAADELRAAQGAAALGQTALAAQDILPGQDPAGPRPRKVALALEKAVAKSGGDVPDYVPEQYRGLIADAARDHDVPANLLSALLQQESGFSEDVIQGSRDSTAGAQGIAQFMPETAAGMGVDPLNPKSAIDGAARLLKGNKDQFGSWDLALAAYNAGGGAVSQYGGIPPYAETQNYVKTIMGNAGDVSSAPAKDISPALIRRSKDILGNPATKAILGGGDVIRDPKAGKGMKVTFDGRYDGAQDLVRYLVGSRVKGDHGGTKNGEAPGEHSAGGDHYAENAYAQDINSPAGNPAENEPAFSQATLDEIYKNTKRIDPEAARSMDEASGGNGLQMGTDWTGSVAGFDVQIFPGTEGSGPHIHIGARNNGEGQQSGTVGDPNIPVKGKSALAVQPAAPAEASGIGGSVDATGTTLTGGSTSTGGSWTPMQFSRGGAEPPKPLVSTADIDVPNMARAAMPVGFGGNFADPQGGDLSPEEQSLIDELVAAAKPKSRLRTR